MGARSKANETMTLNATKIVILTWLRGHHDQQGGSSRVRPFHCTYDWLTLAISPNVGNSGALFVVVGDCVRALSLQNKCTFSLHKVVKYKMFIFSFCVFISFD